MQLIIIAILLMFAFYFGSVYSQPLASSSNSNIRTVSINEKPWLATPWNQSTYALGNRQGSRMGFEIDPHPWDIENDPDYYRWLAKTKYGF